MVAQHALTRLHPATALFWRGLFAALGALLWALRSNERLLIRRLSRRDALQLLLLGALAVPLNQWCFFTGVRMTAAANASLLYALTPVWTLLFSTALGLERLALRKSLGIAMALAGVVSVLLEKEFALGAEHVLGNALLLCASIAWAGFTVLSKPLALRYGAPLTTALSMLIGWLLYIPLWLALGASLQEELLNWWLWAELAYMGLVTSGVGYLLWLIPLRHMEASRVAIFSTLQPVFTTLVTIPLFGFTPTLSFLLGGVLIIAGVVLTQLSS